LEKQNQLATCLATGAAFEAGGKQIFVTGFKSFPNERILYDCVAVTVTPVAIPAVAG
jgi:hypothetical protein